MSWAPSFHLDLLRHLWKRPRKKGLRQERGASKAWGQRQKQGGTEQWGKGRGKEVGWRICVPHKRTLRRRNIIHACLLCKLNFSFSWNDSDIENKELIPATSDADQALKYSSLSLLRKRPISDNENTWNSAPGPCQALLLPACLCTVWPSSGLLQAGFFVSRNCDIMYMDFTVVCTLVMRRSLTEFPAHPHVFWIHSCHSQVEPPEFQGVSTTPGSDTDCRNMSWAICLRFLPQSHQGSLFKNADTWPHFADPPN